MGMFPAVFHGQNKSVLPSAKAVAPALNETPSKFRWLFLSLTLWALAGCNATELVSEHRFEEKVEHLRLGQTNRAEIETLLGPAHVVERHRLTYYFADTEWGIGISRYAPPSGLTPIDAGAFPANTRGVVTVGFNDAENLTQVAVERDFDPPFINDYAFAIKDAVKVPLEATAQIAVANGFKPIDMNQETGTVTLIDNESKAQISVKLTRENLQLRSKNPHSRISTEYRLYTRRKNNLTKVIASPDWVQ